MITTLAELRDWLLGSELTSLTALAGFAHLTSPKFAWFVHLGFLSVQSAVSIVSMTKVLGHMMGPCLLETVLLYVPLTP